MFNRKAPAAVTTLLLLAAVLSSACGPRLVRGQSPYVSIERIDLGEERMTLMLHVQNVNDVAIEASAVRFTIDIEEERLVRYDQPTRLNVIANGSETLRFETTASDEGRSLLEALERGEEPNLEYRISGEISVADGGQLSFSGQGRIYPVPGRPGGFR